MEERDRNSRSLIDEDFARRSLVSMETWNDINQSNGSIPYASGVIVSQKGDHYYFLTSLHHLVFRGDYSDYLYSVRIYNRRELGQYPYRSYDARVIEAFPELDLVLLSFTSDENYPVVPIASVHESLTDIGLTDITLISDNIFEFPNEFEREDEVNITELAYLRYSDGLVDYKGELAALLRRAYKHDYSLIYETENHTAIEKGEEPTIEVGGILLNRDGCLVGIHQGINPETKHNEPDRPIYRGIASNTFLEAIREYTDLDIEPTC